MKRLKVFSLCGCHVTYGGECVTQNYVHLWIVRVEPLSNTRFAHGVRGILPRCEFFSGLDMFESCGCPQIELPLIDVHASVDYCRRSHRTELGIGIPASRNIGTRHYPITYQNCTRYLQDHRRSASYRAPSKMLILSVTLGS